ncbi:MAG: hypothetical protein WCJ58_07785 [bacterium]
MTTNFLPKFKLIPGILNNFSSSLISHPANHDFWQEIIKLIPIEINLLKLINLSDHTIIMNTLEKYRLHYLQQIVKLGIEINSIRSFDLIFAVENPTQTNFKIIQLQIILTINNKQFQSVEQLTRFD